MGVVYRARDTRLHRDVAIKVLPTDRTLRPTAKARFQREALAASALNHPNIITIYEISAEGDTDFIVMEYVRGATLSSLLKKRPLGVNEALHYSVQIADALAKAHAAGIVHRDLKPGNVMITEDGLVKVLDFGLAKFNPLVAGAETEEDSPTAPEFTLTMPGAVTGTPAYQSPEQARGEKVDARSDVFTLGIVMFEMFTRQLPFAGTNTVAFLHNLHFSPPRDLAELRPDLPKPLISLVSRMLEKKLEKRMQSAAEVSTELRRMSGLSESPLSWRPSDTTIEMVRLPSDSFLSRFSRRQIWIAGGVFVIVMASFGTWRVLHKRKVPAGAATTTTELLMPGETAQSLYQRGRRDLDHNDRPGTVDNAIQLLERAVQLDPQSAPSYAALAEAYYEKNRANADPQWVKLASEYANKAVALDNYLAAGHISLGLVQMQAGDSAGAEKQFLMAADLDPKSATPHEWLGHLYDKNGKLDRAASELKRAVELNGTDWRAYMELGLNAYLSGNFKAAASNWEQALKLEPDNVPALENLGAVYHRLSRDDDAVAALQRVIATSPTADVYNNLGSILFYQGKYDEAVPAFEKTVAMGANDFTNWGNLGDAYRWSSTQKDKAPAAYQTATRMVRDEIARHPDQLDLRADLALYLAKAGNQEQALQALKPVEAANPKDPSILYNAAVVYELCGQRDKALDSLLAAVKAGQELNDIKNEPEFVSLRSDPRYQLRILGAVGAKPDQP